MYQGCGGGFFGNRLRLRAKSRLRLRLRPSPRVLCFYIGPIGYRIKDRPRLIQPYMYDVGLPIYKYRPTCIHVG